MIDFIPPYFGCVEYCPISSEYVLKNEWTGFRARKLNTKLGMLNAVAGYITNHDRKLGGPEMETAAQNQSYSIRLVHSGISRLVH